MNKLGYLAIVIGLAAAACGGDSTTPTASGVFPANGFVGRTLTHVEISGDATKWADGATVDFGAGITASNVTVASPTDIFADLAIDPSATPGLNDVTVTSGGTFTLKQAFEVDSPTTVTTTGLVAQGSVPFFTITNHDVENLFDTTAGPADANGNPTFPNIVITAPDGVTALVEGATPTVITGQLLVNVTAGAGGPLTVASGDPTGTPVMSTTDNIAVMARTPIALSSTVASGTLAMPFDTGLYSFDAAAAPLFLNVPLPQPSDQAAAPVVFLIDSTGDLNAGFITGAGVPGLVGQLVQNSGTYYIIVQDQGGDAGYTYSVSATSTAIATVAESAEPADNTVGGANVGASLPFELTGATLASSADVDYIKFTTGVAGMSVHVTTLSGNTTDTVVEVLDGATCTVSLGVSSDQDYDEDLVSNPLTTATFCVKITASSLFDTDGSTMDYTALVQLQ